MSCDLILDGCQLSTAQWQAIIDRLGPYLSAPDDLNEGGTLLLAPGAIRGVLLAVGATSARVRLNPLASPTDYVLGYTLLAMASALGGGTLAGPSGALTPFDLNRKAAEVAANTAFDAAVAQIAAAEGELSLVQVRDWALVVSIDGCRQAGNDQTLRDELLVELSRQCAVRAVATRPPVYLASETAEGPRLKVAPWTLRPTLVPQVDAVLIKHEAGFAVPFEDLCRIVAERVECAGPELFVLPALDADSHLIQALADSQIDLSQHHVIGEA